MKTPLIWCIGAIDSSGGAGLHADIRAATSLSVHSALITTAITVQSHAEVDDSDVVNSAVLEQTMQLLGSERMPDAVKIGVVASDEQARVIHDCLQAIKQTHADVSVIWDPVFTSSSGGKLSQLTGTGIHYILSVSDLITPNIHESALLAGTVIEDDDELQQAIVRLTDRYPLNVLVTGGHHHVQNPPVDILFSRGNHIRYQHRERLSGDVRGSGCTLATAIASARAKGYPLEDAVCIACAYVQEQWQNPFQLSPGTSVFGNGDWPADIHYFPQVHFKNDDAVSQALSFPHLTDPTPGLYPVVDSAAWIAKLLPTGVRMIQLRIKSKPDARLRAEISNAISLCRDHHCQLFINDHWQLAIELGAYGVHLGQEDLATADLKAIQQAGLRLGISTHGYSEICRAVTFQPSYIALGHIFPTTTKDMPSTPQGLDRLRKYAELLQHIPTVAIGGISQERAKAVSRCGVDAVAVVTAITEAADPGASVNALQREITDA